jgi:nitroimidazol reductase NimA-like FMN-containing flavoprotein (pyridoxamine 5'-phosphate oxidase superfamily)
MMGGMDALPLTDRTRVTRLPDRQVVDRQVLHEVLDAGLVAHVGVVRDGVPVILPVGYARDRDSLLLHGSTGGGLLRQAAAGLPVTVTVTLLDGLVYARSLFDSSMNYRCAMVIGTATPVTGPDKLAAMRLLSEHLMPGRWAEVREPTKRELAATLVLRLPLAEASVKLRAAGAEGEPDDGESREVWAGVLPLRTVAGQPEPDPDVPAGVPVPASLDRARRRHLGA